MLLSGKQGSRLVLAAEPGDQLGDLLFALFIGPIDDAGCVDLGAFGSKQPFHPRHGQVAAHPFKAELLCEKTGYVGRGEIGYLLEVKREAMAEIKSLDPGAEYQGIIPRCIRNLIQSDVFDFLRPFWCFRVLKPDERHFMAIALQFLLKFFTDKQGVPGLGMHDDSDLHTFRLHVTQFFDMRQWQGESQGTAAWHQYFISSMRFWNSLHFQEQLLDNGIMERYA